jgi:hypothetical protein
MLMTALTLPAEAGEWHYAVCGKLRQFQAVDAKAAAQRHAIRVQ